MTKCLIVVWIAPHGQEVCHLSLGLDRGQVPAHRLARGLRDKPRGCLTKINKVIIARWEIMPRCIGIEAIL